MTGTDRFNFDGKNWASYLDEITKKSSRQKAPYTIETLMDELFGDVTKALVTDLVPEKASGISKPMLPSKVRTDFTAYKIIDDNEEVIVRVAIPGADKDSLEGDVTKNLLTVSYKVRDLETGELGEVQSLKIELPEGDYSDAGVDLEAIYQDGILSIRLRKVVPSKRTLAISFK